MKQEWLSDKAALWARRRWHELVIERKQNPQDVLNRLKACIGFDPSWIISKEVKHQQS